VATERLDETLPAGYMPRLIKIDVEGAERQVIEGAIEAISRCKPAVWFDHAQERQITTERIRVTSMTSWPGKPTCGSSMLTDEDRTIAKALRLCLNGRCGLGLPIEPGVHALALVNREFLRGVLG
jgi:hypothetical protein